MSDIPPAHFIDPPGCYAGTCSIKHTGTTQIISATDGPIYVVGFAAGSFSARGNISLEYGKGLDCHSPTVLTGRVEMSEGQGFSIGISTRGYGREEIIFLVPPGNGVCVVSTTAPFMVNVLFKDKKPSDCGGAWNECKKAPPPKGL